MLTFTCSGKDADGTFNGRFVFRATPTSSPVPLSTLADLFEGNDQSLSDSVIQHEYLHFVCFKNSTFGIQTVGRRFHARAEHVKGNAEPVIQYYRQRTAYFVLAYPIHEGVVRRLEYKLRQTTASNDPRRVQLDHQLHALIRRTDARARKVCEDLMCKRSLLSTIRDLALGYLATREFGLQAYIREPGGNRKLREISLSSRSSGIINAAFETQLSRQSRVLAIIKRVRRARNTEGASIGMSVAMMARWAAAKFHSEFVTLRDFARDPNFRRYFRPDVNAYIQDYAYRTATFALRHTLFSADPLSVGTLGAAILACDQRSPLGDIDSQLVENFSRLDAEILYYFYVHGN